MTVVEEEEEEEEDTEMGNKEATENGVSTKITTAGVVNLSVPVIIRVKLVLTVDVALVAVVEWIALKWNGV